MSLGMELRLRQHIAITPQLQQALRLLQLSSLEFTQEVEQALGSNPFLEEDTAAPTVTGAVPTASAAPDDGPDAEPGADRRDDAEEPAIQFDAAYGSTTGGARDDDETDWTEWAEAPTGLRDHLRAQLQLSSMSDRDRALTDLIIDELTDAGYLETPLDELAALIAPEHDVAPQELLAALRLVQQLEPAGIGARSLRECLLLQLNALPEEAQGRGDALLLVRDHFDLLAAREFTRIQQQLDWNESRLHGARMLIRTLDPRPGRSFGPDETRYIVPDVIVTCRRGRWQATLNPAVQPRLRINRAYAELAGGREPGERSFSRLLQEARWLMRNVEQRFSTIQRVASAIVEHQRVFFSYGDAAMKPLALKDIAGELGLHESTVCRVTNGKYMATPQGLFEFKHFFSRQLSADDGGAYSPTAIRALIRELIAAEDPAAPLSDARLAHLLSGQGLQLARRTVTKYRSLMRIPSVELRRAAHAAEHPRAA